jgi:hypothetical protein
MALTRLLNLTKELETQEAIKVNEAGSVGKRVTAFPAAVDPSLSARVLPTHTTIKGYNNRVNYS